jgi:ESCRT-I complex subunit TSG101
MHRIGEFLHIPPELSQARTPALPPGWLYTTSPIVLRSSAAAVQRPNVCTGVPYSVAEVRHIGRVPRLSERPIIEDLQNPIMSSLDLTREWLHTVLRPYTARERIVSEVMDIVSSRKTLSVKTDAFSKSACLSCARRGKLRETAYDTGQTALLLLIHGTLPINYRGSTYQIPLHVWVPHDYPRNPPLAFVVPTKEMGVRKGREVEPSGRLKDDVVHGWWNGWEVSGLPSPHTSRSLNQGELPTGDVPHGPGINDLRLTDIYQPKSIEVLLRHLVGIFSATPPVFARPPDSASSPSRISPQIGTREPSLQSSSAQGYARPGPSVSPHSPKAPYAQFICPILVVVVC